ncbi:MAG: hypothetical protein ACLUUF_00045 [Bifidobacterium pullorum]
MRATADFHRYEREDVQAALDGGLCSVVAYVDGVPAGIGRLVGDGRIAFFIKDHASVAPNTVTSVSAP